MNASRPLLRPRTASRSQSGDAASELLQRAIETRTCVTAIYNKGRLTLAPYAVYERDGALFLDAMTIEREGKPPREPKLGAFRLTGLLSVRSTAERFQPQPELASQGDRQATETLARL